MKKFSRVCFILGLEFAGGLFTLIPLNAQTSAMFQEAVPFVDEYGSSGLLQLRAEVPGPALVTLQFKADLNQSAWTDFGPPAFAPGDQVMVFEAPFPPAGGAPLQAYFRLRVEPASVAARNDGRQWSLVVKEPTPAGLVWAALGESAGRDVFPLSEADLFRPVGPLKLAGANLEDLLRAGGLPAWVTPSSPDDPKEAERLMGNRNWQSKPLPPNPDEVGKGRIEEGFQGVSGLPSPKSGPLIPREPHPKADQPLNPNVKPAGKYVLQEPDSTRIDPGFHVRLVAELTQQGEVIPVSALRVPGDALLLDPETGQPSWPERPPLGALVYLVRSPQVSTQPGGIYFIGARPDPFQARSYNPPFRGAHGGPKESAALVRLPLPFATLNTVVKEMEVECYQLEQPLESSRLTPQTFLKQASAFRLLGRVTGDILDRLVSPQFAATRVRPANHILPNPTVTALHVSGSRASKFNMVIIGDGFANTEADQDAFNDYVNATVMEDLLRRDIHPEILNAINIFRINTFSQDSGVTRVDANGNVTVSRNTALQYRYSGMWNRCWMERGPNTVALMTGIVNALVPEADIIAVVLNVGSGGGCARGLEFAVTRTSSWRIFAHEFGHFFGKLGDEYQCNQGAAGCGCYGGNEPGAINLTRQTNRNQIPWNVWIPAWRPLPTPLANVADASQDAGLFAGATIGQNQWWNCIYRPSWRGRMNDNSPPHNPVGYTRMREEARPRQGADLRKNVAGDFNGDGRTDLVLLDGRQLSLYLAGDRDTGPDDPVRGAPPRHVTGVLEPVWYFTDRLTNSAGTRSWQIRGSDLLFPGDFDGDGQTDLYVVNLQAWNKPYLGLLRSTGDGFEPVARYDGKLPGWSKLSPHDEFYVADFTGDGRDDLLVFNGQDWIMPYFLMLRSTGGGLAYSRRYDQYLPGWGMGRHEKFFVGDFNGDGHQDVCALDRNDWRQVHLRLYLSNGQSLALADRHYGTIQFPFWTMRRHDQLYVLDFNKDGRDDLALFNGRDWSPEYLALFATTAKVKLAGARRYEDRIPGWDLNRRDRFYVADVNGDQADDLVVYNKDNWSTQYLGILRSDGQSRLSGSWQDDRIGAWNLGAQDEFRVADFRGDGGWDDLFVFNRGWFGLLRGKANRFQLEAIYRKWIHNHRYHGLGWW